MLVITAGFEVRQGSIHVWERFSHAKPLSKQPSYQQSKHTRHCCFIVYFIHQVGSVRELHCGLGRLTRTLRGSQWPLGVASL
ncbi:MAG: hypothetical protein ACKPKO_02430, partial [Candidatus Fonsibacter sp.]